MSGTYRQDWLADSRGAVDYEEYLETCLDLMGNEITELRLQKDMAYTERNRLVLALAHIFPASLEKHTGNNWGPEWQWVCIMDTPMGQLSWHIPTSEISLFSDIPRLTGRVWDGHTSEEKYDRLLNLKTCCVAAFEENEKLKAAMKEIKDELERCKSTP